MVVIIKVLVSVQDTVNVDVLENLDFFFFLSRRKEENCKIEKVNMVITIGKGGGRW